MKIAFFETRVRERNYLRKNLKGHHIEFYNDTLDENNADKVKDFDIWSEPLF